MGEWDGFDPLSASTERQEDQMRAFKRARKKGIRNILDCYTGYFDVFSEMIQNGLDATEKMYRDASNDTYTPKLLIDINIDEKAVMVADNGVGMSEEEFKFCLAPNITFKEDEPLRGKKGVGATFLAYGFDGISIHTKQSNFEARVKMNNGNSWALDDEGEYKRPHFKDLEYPIDDFLSDYNHGSIFKVETEGKKPDLRYINADTAKQWYQVLRVRSPLGGIYLTQPDDGKFKPEVLVRVTKDGEIKKYHSEKGAEYYFPHEIPETKTEDAEKVHQAISEIPAGTQEREERLSDEYKNLDGIWNIWTSEQILSPDSDIDISQGLDQEQKELIEKHNVSIYGYFCYSTAIFDTFNNDNLDLRKDYMIMKGGLQLASDGMPQGELITIPLQKYIGYQEQSHVIVHFEHGEPDLGRKTFQKDKTELARKLSVNTVQALMKFRNPHLKPTKTGTTLVSSRELHQWKRKQEDHFEDKPLEDVNGELDISVLSKPNKEQDVVALFHELIGDDVFRGFQIYATSEHETYDSLFRLDYQDESLKFSDDNKIGVDSSIEVGNERSFPSEPKVLEFKVDFDSLAKDVRNEDKTNDHIDWVVCWDCSLAHQDQIELRPLLVGDRGENRRIYGSTHLAYNPGSYDQPLYEVTVLKDLLQYLEEPERTEERMKVKYEE